MRDHAALGLASRAAGVDNIGEVIRSDGGGGIVVRLGGEEVSGFVKKEGLALMGGELFGGNALGEQDVRTGVFEHEGETPRRVAEVDGEVGGSGFEDAEEGAEEFWFAAEAEADEGVGTGSLTDEPMGDAVGAVVEFLIGEGETATIDGDAVGVLRGDFFKPAVQAGRFRVTYLMGIESVDERVALGCIEEGEAADFLIGEGDEGVGKSDKMGEPALDGFLPEKVATEGAADGHAVMALEDVDAEVEGEAALGIAHGGAGKGACGDDFGSGLEGEGGGDETLAFSASEAGEGAEDFAQGDVLVFLGGKGKGARALDERGGGFEGIEGGAEREELDAVAGQIQEADIGLTGDGHADEEIRLAGEAVQQDLINGEEGVIGSDLLSAAEAAQAVGKIGGEVGFGREGFVAGRKGGRTVGGKQERGGAGFELLGPVGCVRGKSAGGALGLLFAGVGGVAGGGGELGVKG